MHSNLFNFSKILLFIAPFSLVIVSTSTLFPFIVGKYTFFKIVIELALISFILGIGFSSNKLDLKKLLFDWFKSPLVIAVTAFVFLFTLSGFTGVNPSASFWSNFERGEGSFLMLHFYVYFILLLALFSNEKDWRHIFRLSIISGIFVMFYGILGAMNVRGVVGNDICDRFAGSLGNPAYIGTLSIFLLFYVMYFIASGNWKSKNWKTIILPFLILLVLFFFAFLTLSQTRGGFLGLGAGTILGMFYMSFSLPKHKWRIYAFLMALGLVGLGLSGIYFRQHINLAPWCGAGANRILDVSISGATINTRFALWGQAIEAWKERPIFGWGPENFSIAFEKYYNPVHTVWFDRAHNIFFDYLVFSGIMGLSAFVGIFAVLYFQFFKKHWKNKFEINDKHHVVDHKKYGSISDLSDLQLSIVRALIFAVPIAYLVQGIVLFDVLPIYINLFLFLAFVEWKLNQGK